MASDHTQQTPAISDGEIAELLALRERVAALEAIVARLTQSPDADEVTPVSREERAPATQERAGKRATGRRALLKTAGIAAAAALAAGAAVEAGQHGSVAHASGATPMYQSTDNAATATTSLTLSSGASANPVFLADASFNNTTGNNGVHGFASANSSGVFGISNGAGGWGLQGQSDMGYGVVGASASGIDLAAIAGGRIFQQTAAFIGAPTSGSYLTGEQFRDGAGDLYICVAGGTPGTWRRVAAGVPGHSGAINFLASPIRLLDTRASGSYAAGSVHTLQVTGVSVGSISVPAGAVGVVGNVTVVNPTGGGDLRLYPSATAPNTSSINFASGQVIANGVTVGLNSSGQLNIKVDMPTGTHTNVLFDASGYIL